MGDQDLQRRVRVLEELVNLLIEAVPPGPREEIQAKAKALKMTTGMLDYLRQEDKDQKKG